MADRDLLTIAYKEVEIIDLDDLAKGSVRVPKLTQVSHSLEPEREEIRYEDSVSPNLKVLLDIGGEINLVGNLEFYNYPAYDAGVRTKPLFEFNHFYLTRFIALHKGASGVTRMVYGRWIGQLENLPQEDRSAGELSQQTTVLAVTSFGQAGYLAQMPYQATAAADPTPQGDFDPVFMAHVPDATKTLAQAEIEVAVTNP